MDEITVKILQRIDEGPLPLETTEAESIAPLSRYKELKDKGFITGAAIRGASGEVERVKITSLTYEGRNFLEQSLTLKKQNAPTTKALKFTSKILWMIFGSALTLLTLYLAKKLGLK